jgi:hypothetical protein
MSDPLSEDAVIAKAISLKVGERVKCIWSRTDDPTRLTWHGSVVEVKDNFATAKWDEVPNQLFRLPYEGPGVCYYHIGPEAGPVYGDWLAAARVSVSSLGIVPWQPKSWKALIRSQDATMGRHALLQELREYFKMRPRSAIGPDTPGPNDYEKATLYEVLLAWVSFAQSIEQWNSPAFIAIVEPLLLRLCALRRGSIQGITQDERSREMQAVYDAFMMTTPTNDKLSEVMLRPLSKKH